MHLIQLPAVPVHNHRAAVNCSNRLIKCIPLAAKLVHATAALVETHPRVVCKLHQGRKLLEIYCATGQQSGPDAASTSPAAALKTCAPL